MQVILIGIAGSGKTTLFNIITNSNEQTYAGGRTATKQVVQKLSAYGNFQFNVLDTPGFGEGSHKMKRAAGAIVALTERPVNRILITIRAERIDYMKQNYKNLTKPIQNYLHLVTVAVTHMDSFRDDQKMQEEKIQQTFLKLNCNSIIFISKKDSGNQICENILKELSNSKAEKIDYKPSELLYLFDVMEFSEEFEEAVRELEFDIMSQFGKITRFVKDFLRSNSTTETSEGISNVCKILSELKNKQLKYLEQFELSHLNSLMSLEQEQIFLVHKLLVEKIEREYSFVCSQVKDQFYFNKQLQAEYGKVVGSENIYCTFENNQEWKNQLERSEKMCLEKLQQKIVEQKQRIVRL